MQRFPVTPVGHLAMKAALKQLIEVDRPENVRAIEEARAHGDLSENAEYDYAKDQQGMIDAKIRDLEGRLALAEVIDPSTLSGDRVMFGATVSLEDVDTDEELTYQIVGTYEADIKLGKISVGRQSVEPDGQRGRRRGCDRSPEGQRSSSRTLSTSKR